MALVYVEITLSSATTVIYNVVMELSEPLEKESTYGITSNT